MLIPMLGRGSLGTRLTRGGDTIREMSGSDDISPFLINRDTPISKLCCSEAFQGLADREKRMFGGQSLSSLKATALECGLTQDEYQAVLMFAASFYSNMGNYKSFGDTKFIPNVSSDKLHTLVKSCEAYRRDPAALEDLWTAISNPLYSLDRQKRQLAFPPEGLTTYYSGNCTKEDAELVKDFMIEKNISPYNTRLFKCVRDGKTTYEIKIASCEAKADPTCTDDNVAPLLGAHTYHGATVVVSRGDYSLLMARMNEELIKAKDHASNDNERQMLEQYILSFNCGSVDAHKNGSRFWIRNKGPVVETYIGFIETYRDPYGVRAEYEGFVAVVNKAMSAKFTKLVDSAESFLPLLPWPREFEKDRFLRPDFTSLDVLAYGSSGIPAGINIPNYDEIRQDEGFKNVSLGNVLAAASQDKRVTFLSPEDQELYVKLRSASFEVQVGLHELLGHGSGKLLKQDEDGQFNFDTNSIINPLTGDKVTSWYGAGETWDSVFSTIASTYEECRAECVGIYLCSNKDVLSIFGYEGSDADDIVYINWLNMVRAGLLGLEFYTPESKQWRQAHMQGRYVILRVLMECGNDLVSIKRTTDSNGQPDLIVSLDRHKIESVGRPAIGEFLKKLQIYKSLADPGSGCELYNRYCTVTDEHLALRDIVMARKLPRRLLVQPHTKIEENGDITLVEFDSTVEGIIESFLARFPSTDTDLESLWRKDMNHWN